MKHIQTWLHNTDTVESLWTDTSPKQKDRHGQFLLGVEDTVDHKTLESKRTKERGKQWFMKRGYIFACIVYSTPRRSRMATQTIHFDQP